MRFKVEIIEVGDIFAHVFERCQKVELGDGWIAIWHGKKKHKFRTELVKAMRVEVV